MTVTTRRRGRTSATIRWRLVVATLAAMIAGAPLSLPEPTLATAGPVRAEDQVRDSSWHLAQLRVAEAHRVTQGDGITVAVIDTGVDATHPDLVGNVLPGYDVLDPANPHRGQRDHTGHGTAMASLIAGHGHGPGGRDGVLGIAPKVRILPLNVYDTQRKDLSFGALGNAIRLAVDNGADVVCIAIGGSFEQGSPAAVQYARERNVLVVAAVGNPPDPLVASPANIPEVVAVTGIDRSGKITTTVRGEIDIAAPADDIVSARPGGRYDTADGTSNSTAIVAGALALIRSKNPNADRNEQLRRLVWTTTDLGQPGKDTTYGWGALNLVNALTAEPQVPAGVQASASTTAGSSADAVSPQAKDSSGDDGTLIAVVGGVLFLAVVAIAVVALIWVRRRRRAGTTAPVSGLDVADRMD